VYPVCLIQVSAVLGSPLSSRIAEFSAGRKRAQLPCFHSDLLLSAQRSDDILMMARFQESEKLFLFN
jgi:hypothetical protein